MDNAKNKLIEKIIENNQNIDDMLRVLDNNAYDIISEALEKYLDTLTVEELINNL